LYEPPETGGPKAKQKPAIQYEGDTVNVKLQTRLTRSSFTTTQSDDQPVAEDNPNIPRSKAPSLKPGRASTGLVGFFHALIQKAQLNGWQIGSEEAEASVTGSTGQSPAPDSHRS